MKQLTAFFVLIFCLVHLNFSQNVTIKGTVIDMAEKTNLAQSVVALLKYEDSTLVKFTRSDKDGKFVLKDIPAGLPHQFQHPRRLARHFH